MAYDRRRNQYDLISLRAEKGDEFKLEQTFQVKINSAFTAMREDLGNTAKETNAYADKMLGLLGELEELHLRRHAGFQIVKGDTDVNKEKLDGLLSTYYCLLNKLAPCRQQVIQAGEEATQVQSTRMRKLCKDLMDAAKHRLDEGREKHQLATDASELMKHYKALIMAT